MTEKKVIGLWEKTNDGGQITAIQMLEDVRNQILDKRIKEPMHAIVILEGEDDMQMFVSKTKTVDLFWILSECARRVLTGAW